MKKTLAFLLAAVMTASAFAIFANFGNSASGDATINTTAAAKKSAVTVSKQPNLKSKDTQAEAKSEYEPEFDFYSNSLSKLNLTNSDSYMESWYPNNAYHPKLIDMGKEWNGYRFWLSYTPYPKGNDYYENPQIVGTNAVSYTHLRAHET